jgi:anti-anti-sigma regulatory factor
MVDFIEKIWPHVKRSDMGKISVSEGRVCIIKTQELTSVKEGLEQIKTALIQCSSDQHNVSTPLDTFLFVDLSLFNIINSSVIGVLGSVLMNPSIRLLGLCGVQPPVVEILTRFGVLSAPQDAKGQIHDTIKGNMMKVATFDSVEQGLGSLNPS